MKLSVSLSMVLLGILVSGCMSASISEIGPVTEFSEPDYRMDGLVTLVELDDDGIELARTNSFSQVLADLGLSEDDIASVDRSDGEASFAAQDYLDFKEANGFAKAQYPAGRSGHRRLEFLYPSPSKHCPEMRFKVSVQWRWRQNRVVRSRISGYYLPPLSASCIPGELRADRTGGTSATRRRPGSVGYSYSITVGVPVEDVDSGEIVRPPEAADDHFGGGSVSVRGDGTARFGGRYGVTSKSGEGQPAT